MLGGYGHVGQLCGRELVESTRARVVVAGRSIQRAARIASSFGDRARPAYANADDVRTLQRLIPDASAIVACGPDPPLAALQVAIESRTPFIALSPTPLSTSQARELEEQAWKQQVPIVLHAGAIPGLPGVLAEFLLREYPSLHEIRMASTGSTSSPEAAGEASASGWRSRGRRWKFPEPIGALRVRPSHSADLDGFARSHCVEEIVYLEPQAGVLMRGLRRIQRNPAPHFALTAEAYLTKRARDPERRITVEAPDVHRAAAVAACALVGSITQESMPGGVFTPHEALNPALFLEILQKRGLQVSFA